MEQLYLIVNIAILAGPFALSFDRRVAFFTHWRQLLLAILPVSAIYLIWDVFVTPLILVCTSFKLGIAGPIFD